MADSARIVACRAEQSQAPAPGCQGQGGTTPAPRLYHQGSSVSDDGSRGISMLSFLRDLLAHAEWANAVFFHAWGKSPARDHEEMRQRVGHVVGVQQAFLAML